MQDTGNARHNAGGPNFCRHCCFVFCYFEGVIFYPGCPKFDPHCSEKNKVNKRKARKANIRIRPKMTCRVCYKANGVLHNFFISTCNSALWD